MRFKLDENLPLAAAIVLRSHGHDVVSVLDQVASGSSDAIIAEMVRRESRILLTLDLDFADIRAYRPSDYAGILVLRPRELNAAAVLVLVERLVLAFETRSPIGCLWIVEHDRIRIHGEPG